MDAEALKTALALTDVWKTVAYILGGVIISLAATIAAMAKWYISKNADLIKDNTEAKSNMYARLQDIYQVKQGMILAVQKVFDLMLRGKIQIVDNVQEIKDRDDPSITQIRQMEK